MDGANDGLEETLKCEMKIREKLKLPPKFENKDIFRQILRIFFGEHEIFLSSKWGKGAKLPT